MMICPGCFDPDQFQHSCLMMPPPGEGPESRYPECKICDRELAPELDAYYGLNPYYRETCYPCRKERGIK